VPRDDFEELWRDHFRSVTRTAYLITGDPQEAYDCAQEAFVRALQRWSKVGSLEKPEGWVHRVAANLAISSARRHRFPRTIQTPSVVSAPEPPDDELRRALLQLTPAQRAVIALRFYLDWSVGEVAEALGKAPGTVRALTHQGMQRLRESAPQETTDE
jgi:RNA polymerase sigma-70 factor (sigma-E family)